MATFADLLLLLRGDTSDLDKKIRGSQQELSKFASITNQLGSSLTSLGTRLTAAITLPMAGVAVASLKLSGELEQNKIAFTTMLGSADAAQKHLEALRAFAMATPFQFTDLVLASKRLQALGFSAKEVIPTLTSVGNAAAALGTGSVGIERITLALGQMLGKGRVQSQEMRQLAEAGIPAWQILAKTLNTDVAGAMKKVEDGAVTSGKAVPAILAGINERFGGLMDAQSKTLLGRFSNFKDLLDKTLSDIGEKLAPMAGQLLDFGQKGLAQIKGLADAFSKLPPPIQATAAAMAGLAAVAGPGLFIVGQLASSVGSISTALKVVTPLIARFFATFGGALGAATGVGALAAAIAYLLNKLDQADHNTDHSAETNKKLTAIYDAQAGVIRKAADPYGNLVRNIVEFTDAAKKASTAPDPVTLEAFQHALEKLGIKGTSTQIKELTDAFATVSRSGKLGAAELKDAYNELQIKIAQLKSELQDKALTTLGVTPDSGLLAQADALRIVQQQFFSGKATVREYVQAQEAYNAAALKTTDLLPILSENVLKVDGAIRNAGFSTAIMSAEFNQLGAEVNSDFILRMIEESTKLGSTFDFLSKETISVAGALRSIGEATPQETADKIKTLQIAFDSLSASASIGVPGALNASRLAFNRLQSAMAEAADTDPFKALGIKSQASLKILADTAKANFEDIKGDAQSTSLDIARAWLKMIDAQVAAGAVLDESTRKQYARITTTVSTSTKDQTKFWTTLGHQVSTIMTDLSRGISDAIVHFKGFGELATKVVQDIASAILRLLIENAFKKMLDALSGVGGAIGKIATALGGVTSSAKTAADAIAKIATPPFSTTSGIPGIPGVPNAPSSIPGVSPPEGAASGAGAAGSIAGVVGGGVAGVVTAVSSVITAISSVIGNFQMHDQLSKLKYIEENTRSSAFYLGGDNSGGGILHAVYMLTEQLTWGYLTKAAESINTRLIPIGADIQAIRMAAGGGSSAGNSGGTAGGASSSNGGIVSLLGLLLNELSWGYNTKAVEAINNKVGPLALDVQAIRKLQETTPPVPTNGGSSTGQTFTGPITITVQDSADPKATAKEIMTMLKRLDPSFV